VVVVVTGLRIVVSSDVVVVVLVAVPLSVAHAASDNRATAARHGRISLFISVLVVWMLTLQLMDYATEPSRAMGCNPNMPALTECPKLNSG